jgi:hypothetical protein
MGKTAQQILDLLPDIDRDYLLAQDDASATHLAELLKAQALESLAKQVHLLAREAHDFRLELKEFFSLCRHDGININRRGS